MTLAPSPTRAPAPVASQPRAQGHARITARLRNGRSRIGALYEQGSAKIRVPRTQGPALQAVILNTAGGITGGDDLRYDVAAEDGAWLTLATQTAERAYRAQPGTTGRLTATMRIAPGATLEWLAQETILFDRCAFSRSLSVEMAADARLLLVEPVVLGREAMGERVARGAFRDSQSIRRDGRLIYADMTRIDGPLADVAAHPAALRGARAWATLLYAAPDAEDRLEALRAVLPGTECGASAFDGMISARIVSPDGYELRRTLAQAMRLFRNAPLPRVWEM
ncbi:MAG: urease accessory protein UreD [Rubrimonas sp.]